MQFKLLQWNILYKEKLEKIVELIKEVDPDVFCLQELGINCKYNPSISNAANYIRDELGYNLVFKEAQRWKNDDELDAIGNGVFSRFPIITSTSKYVQNQSKEFTDYAHEGRIYVQAEIELVNQVIVVGTTHLSYTHKFEITDEKKVEVDNLLKLVNNKVSKFILTGDLNSIPNSYTITELSKLFQNSSPPYDQNTWTTKPFEHKGFKADRLNWRLDYIFSTKDMKNISSRIIETNYSDHLPIETIFEI